MKEIEVTQGINGYPKGLYKAVVGFETYEQAEDYAKENGGNIQLFRRRDGWHYYESRGLADEPMKITYKDYGDDYNVGWQPNLDDFKEDIDFLIENEITFSKYGGNTMSSRDELTLECLESVQKRISEYKELLEEYDVKGDDEVIVTCCGAYYDTIQKKAMEWSHDTWHYVIGVTIENEQ